MRQKGKALNCEYHTKTSKRAARSTPRCIHISPLRAVWRHEHIVTLVYALCMREVMPLLDVAMSMQFNASQHCRTLRKQLGRRHAMVTKICELYKKLFTVGHEMPTMTLKSNTRTSFPMYRAELAGGAPDLSITS